MQNTQIVPITEELIAGYWAALDSVAKERQYLARLQGPPLEVTRKFALEHIEKNWPHFLAINAGNVVGWCDITPSMLPIFTHSGSLGMGVIADYRGHGIGEALMRASIKQAKSIGLTRVELTVRENNKRAFALYKKLGFQVEGINRKAVRVDGEYEDLICMAILIDDTPAPL